jgi:hypothetical protein
MRTSHRFGVLAVALLGLSSAVRADTIALGFAGGSDFPALPTSSSPYVDLGGGSFDAPEGTTTVVPSDFTLDRGVDKYNNLLNFATYGYVAADLTSFSVTIANGIVTNLSFTTGLKSPSFSLGSGYGKDNFNVSGGSAGFFDYTTSTSSGVFTSGILTAIDLNPSSTSSGSSTASAAPLPQPAVAGIALLGLLGAGRLLRRQAAV